MKTKSRIGVLNKMWQRAEKVYRTATEAEYEREAILIYGFLREAWERALEEVLLGGVVERYRKSVQTQQIGRLSKISEEECDVLENSMAKCSGCLPGHDKSPADNPPVPHPEELKKASRTRFGNDWRGGRPTGGLPGYPQPGTTGLEPLGPELTSDDLLPMAPLRFQSTPSSRRASGLPWERSRDVLGRFM